MSISNSQLASDLGWDNGWEIPVANEENKTLSSQLAAKTREKDLYSGKIMFSTDRTVIVLLRPIESDRSFIGGSDHLSVILDQIGWTQI